MQCNVIHKQLICLNFCKGGPSIQEECNRYIQAHGPLIEGLSVLTDSGKLPCKKVIHAVGPLWRGGTEGECDVLHDCVYNHILQVAVDNDMSVIALPPISSGVFGFPIHMSTSVILEAINDFLDDTLDKKKLSEIHLYDTEEDGTKAFLAALKKTFKVTQSKGTVARKKSTKRKGIITVRKRSCGKVMFLHLSVSHSVHRFTWRCLGYTPLGRHPLGRHPPGQTHPLPSACRDTRPMLSACCGRYTSYWNAFLFIRSRE